MQTNGESSYRSQRKLRVVGVNNGSTGDFAEAYTLRAAHAARRN